MPILLLLILVLWPLCGEDPVPPPEAAVSATRPLLHIRTTTALRVFAQRTGLKILEYGKGPVRIWWVCHGEPMPDGDRRAQLGEKALQMLEDWFGKPGCFLRKPHPEGENYHVVLFEQAADAVAWIHGAREAGLIPRLAQGEVDLQVATRNLNLPRVNSQNAEGFEPIYDHMIAYSVGALALDAWYRAETPEAHHPPRWLREGVTSELQRRICDRQVRVYTIEYELNSTPLDEDWHRVMVKMIQKRSPMLMSAEEVMAQELVSLKGEQYVQLWSFFALLLDGAAEKPKQNRLLEVLRDTGHGLESKAAVKKAYGMADPRLTQLWRTWAQNRRW